MTSISVQFHVIFLTKLLLIQIFFPIFRETDSKLLSQTYPVVSPAKLEILISFNQKKII